ncbi:hypothetical protein LS70_009615 [Helicobacter sp. MIT 11-5569]|uniref:putative toxin n=1 Tax=Helicobacter sp. MIT 11-5569 TaxID=1548151 RepID=UPI00051FE354|nr:putative toxin [Helicobacter sp. MIT 11-5569]TLD79755.1 hypothetical protein LS70_009615 [Helicobacter sp. MIT 11-5569]
MAKNIEINFAEVEFHIKEFQKVYILENCSLVFYAPKEKHMQSKEGKKNIQIKQKDGTKSFLVDDKGNKIKHRTINKSESQGHIKAINKEKEEKISKLGLNADNIDKHFAFDEEGNSLNLETAKMEEDYQKQKEERRKKIEESKNKRLQKSPKKERAEKFKDYDIFYDVYTNKDNIKSCIGKFKVNNGIAKVEASFFQECLGKGIYNLIPRLISKQKNKDLHFDPVPLEDKGFVVTDFRVDNIKNVKKDLIFQRRIAEIENSSLILQSPQKFLSALNGGRDFTQDDKKRQAEAIQKGCELKAKEMEKILGVKEEASIEEIEKRMNEISSNKNRTPKEQNEFGRLEFLKNNKEKVEDYQGIIKKLKNPQAADNQQSNTGASNIEDTDKEKTNTPNGNKSEDESKTINAKDIGDTGEYMVSLLLFSNKCTRYLSNRRKMDANFNLNGFNHTIPDFLVTLNDYPTLVEVKNVQEQSLTEQISFELKLAREYDLDYLFVCNDYTKLMNNITKLVEFDAAEHKGSRSGFIDHRHLHRSIKTAFKEIYIHHIKGVAPNKIMIKRMDLNDAAKMEKEFNEKQNLQKN